MRKHFKFLIYTLFQMRMCLRHQSILQKYEKSLIKQFKNKDYEL